MDTHQGRLSPSLVFLPVLAFLSCFGCVTEQVRLASKLKDQARVYQGDRIYRFSPMESRYNVDPLLAGDEAISSSEESLRDYDPFAKYAAQTYYSADGTITRHYYLPQGQGKNIANLLVAHVGGLSFFSGAPGGTLAMDKVVGVFDKNKLGKNQVMVIENAIMDSRPSAQVDGLPGKSFGTYAHQTGSVSDLMVVTADSPAKLLEVDSFLTSLLTELPMVEIKVRVVELAMSDEWQWGNENIISYLTSSSKAFLKEWFNFYSSEAYGKAGGAENFQGSIFNAFGVHDKLQLDAAFQLFERIMDAEVLSAPTMVVLNGHRAIIETGDREPLPYVVSTPTAASYSYTYKQLGVRLIIVPYVLPGDIIEIHLTAEVAGVTGRESFQTYIGTLSQPVISRRSACTRLRIKEGQAFALGGLMSDEDLQVVTKLPLLGDIPVLGYLFKNKKVQKGKSQIIFYVEPHVVTREDLLKETGTL